MKAGIFDVTAARYHADELGADVPMLSASLATILLRDSPAHAHAAHPLLGGGVKEESETFDLGTAAHSLVLEGSEAGFAVVEANDWRTKLAKEAREAARAAGKTPILAHQVESVRVMSAAIRAQLAAFQDSPAPLTNGRPEQVMVWEDEGGVWCKARVDWLHNDRSTIDDLKTVGTSASPNAWQKTLYGRSGDIQVGFYLRGLKKLTGIDADFRFVVAENRYPFAVSVCGLTPEGLAHADDKVQQAITLWARCLRDDHWPAFPTRTCYIDPPAWAMSSWMEQEDANSGDETPRGLAATSWERS